MYGSKKKKEQKMVGMHSYIESSTIYTREQPIYTDNTPNHRKSVHIHQNRGIPPNITQYPPKTPVKPLIWGDIPVFLNIPGQTGGFGGVLPIFIVNIIFLL